MKHNAEHASMVICVKYLMWNMYLVMMNILFVIDSRPHGGLEIVGFQNHQERYQMISVVSGVPRRETNNERSS